MLALPRKPLVPADPAPIEFDAEEIVRVLNAHDVEYVLIGGLACVLHGAPIGTVDVDITPARTEPNLTRLAAALRALDARLRVPGEAHAVDLVIDARTFRQTQTVTFRTRAGDLDVALLPDGTDGYPDLVRGRVLMTIDDVTFPVASLSDVIRSKAAARRPKDMAVLDLLREVDRRRGSD
jgi:hypothetical protein